MTPARDAAGKFIGIDWETIIYDSEALGPAGSDSVASKLQQDGRRPSGSDGRSAPALFIRSMATRVPLRQERSFEYRVPDMTDRPWAKIWEEYFEKKMQRPKQNSTWASNEHTNRRAG